ncbi:MAG TPA: branched-chain amino acid ABC transporter permease [Candidatus Limnocylindrales bacterium]|nr:branched-chain amino acid ABC transporter permease [Candidatus Limnocylindrales bacterium]
MSLDFVNLANVVISGLLTGIVYGLMALGLSVIFGVARVVNFAHGEMVALAMYLSVLLFSTLHLEPLLSAAPVAVVFFIFGYVLYGAVIHPFVTRPEHSQFILLLAVGIIITNSLLILFGPDARAVSLDYLLEPIELGPLLIDRGKLYAGLIAFGAAAGLFALFGFTHTGTAIRACADNWLGAKVVGLDVKRLYALAFGLGSACGGIAGCMMIMLVDLTPGLGPAYTLLAFVIVIVGGLGSMTGALVGGVLIGVSEALAGFYVTPSAKGMYSFALLILVLLFRPRGLLGNKL